MFNLEDCVCFISNKCNKEIIEAFNNSLLPYNITRPQWIAIYYIQKNDSITQKQLSNLIDSKESTIVRLIDRMEKENLVERKKDPNDRRITMLCLTSKGKSTYNEILPIAINFSKNIIKNIDENDLIIFKNVFNKILKNSKTL